MFSPIRALEHVPHRLDQQVEVPPTAKRSGRGGVARSAPILEITLSLAVLSCYASSQMTSQGAHKAYLDALRRMTAEQRLLKALELTRLVRDLHLHGLRRRFPQHSEPQIREIFFGSLKRCWNRNY